MALAVAGQRITPSLLNRTYCQADGNAFTVTAATHTQLSSSYTIAANDASAGMAYRLTAFGTGTWGSTQQQLQLYTYANGVQIQNAGIPAAAFPVSNGIYWEAVWTLIFASTGVSASVINSEKVQISTTAASSTANTPVRNSTNTMDSTSAITLQFQASWAATTGAPTISCAATMFERLGN